jgi:hypothetical protein
MVSPGAPGLALAAMVSAGTLAGCTLLTDSFLSNDFSGDAYPVNVNTETGAIIVGVRPTGGEETTAVLDLLSPLTTSDPDPLAHPLGTPDVTTTDLALLGMSTPSASVSLAAVTPENSVERARFVGAQLISIHACDQSDLNANGECHIGHDPALLAFQSVLGADSLAGDAVRLRLADDQIFVLPDVGGSDHQRSLDCDAVYDSPYRGGGTLVIAGTETSFGNRRIALAACLGPHPEASLQAKRGTDALFVVSTAIGMSIIGKSAYARYKTDRGDTSPDGDAQSVFLPSGLVRGTAGTLESLALVAPQAGNALAPCRQVYAHRIIEHGPAPEKICIGNSTPGNDCPCEDGSPSCNVPAIVELNPPQPTATGTPASIAVLVVDDADPTLQALRTELRPDQPEVDGILGTEALKLAEIDVDYPHDRLLARCRGGACCARPELVDTTDEQLAQINRCITAQPMCQTTSVIPTP